MNAILIHTSLCAGDSEYFCLHGGIHHHCEIDFVDDCLLSVVSADCDGNIIIRIYDHSDHIYQYNTPYNLRDYTRNDIVWETETFVHELGLLTPELLKNRGFSRI